MKIFGILTVFFLLLFILMLGVDDYLFTNPYTYRTPNWVVGLGLLGFFGTLVSGGIWVRAMVLKHRSLRVQETQREAQARRDAEIRLKEDRLRKRHQAEEDRLRKRRLAEEMRLRKSEEEHRLRIESLLRRDAVRDEINYMSGLEFEKFMADLFRLKGYRVEATKATGDQGVDLLLPDFEGKRIAVQLKRYTGPVGNKAVQATFAGMAHYRAEEGWIMTTGTFTKSARELARSTRVRLIDGKELAEWLEDLRGQE